MVTVLSQVKTKGFFFKIHCEIESLRQTTNTAFLFKSYSIVMTVTGGTIFYTYL